MSDEQTPEPQLAQLATQAPHGGSQDYGSDWVQYALNTATPPQVQGVDYSLNPSLGGIGDGGSAYA